MVQKNCEMLLQDGKVVGVENKKYLFVYRSSGCVFTVRANSIEEADSIAEHRAEQYAKLLQSKGQMYVIEPLRLIDFAEASELDMSSYIQLISCAKRHKGEGGEC
jgi:hypothetical protein